MSEQFERDFGAAMRAFIQIERQSGEPCRSRLDAMLGSRPEKPPQDLETVKQMVLANLALGRGFSDQEREAVENSKTMPRHVMVSLLGHKLKQAPILDLLAD